MKRLMFVLALVVFAAGVALAVPPADILKDYVQGDTKLLAGGQVWTPGVYNIPVCDHNSYKLLPRRPNAYFFESTLSFFYQVTDPNSVVWDSVRVDTLTTVGGIIATTVWEEYPCKAFVPTMATSFIFCSADSILCYPLFHRDSLK